MDFRLNHWDSRNPGFLDLAMLQTSDQIDFAVQNDADDDNTGRAVVLEVRDDGTLAVLCYPRDRDEPVTVLLSADGGFAIASDTN